MTRIGSLALTVIVALAALISALLLTTAPEAVRWALLICSLGVVGATLRLWQIDARL